jgi:phage gp36-like protein
MSYATDAEIELAAGGEDRLVALADWDGDQVVDAEVIARAKAAADGLIDGYLRLKLGPDDLARVRATPTPTLSSIAAAEAVYWMKSSRNMAGPDDVEQRKERERQLKLMNAGSFRVDDAPKAQRAAFIENDGEVTKKNTRGMW